MSESSSVSVPAAVEGFAPFGEWKTWYRVTGDLAGPKTPLIVLHGGPGCTHDYVDSFKDLAATGRAVIHYDQIGNGHSTHLPEKGGDFWTPALFMAELDNLIDHLACAAPIACSASPGAACSARNSRSRSLKA
ncbi:L-amino acid amidase [Methylobrevis pamukkalensis]|uniref:L-amino acid amidase n=1 Tax=Methylobrevis pamukkalensis TaxID=1439726 RepID=A0A1E3H1Z6_9HYPH|nr:L-amino acid amidase [Methylobrevis pamukkalensis]